MRAGVDIREGEQGCRLGAPFFQRCRGSGVGGGSAGVQAHPQKFFFAENLGKNPKNLAKISENLGKISENLNQITKCLGKII